MPAIHNITGPTIALYGVITVAFAAFARLLRAVSTSGSVVGGLVCFCLMLAAGWGGFAGLGSVFLLTWTATRVGYGKKQNLGIAEPRSGRNASQVLANLGVAAGVALLFAVWPGQRMILAMAASLAEVASDTLSSEIGLVLGGTPRLITTWQSVPAGTDGAITWSGTLAGVFAALVVGLVCVFSGVFPVRELTVCAAAAVAGTIADSVLGATLERKGILGNNAVNFLATAIAAAIAWILA